MILFVHESTLDAWVRIANLTTSAVLSEHIIGGIGQIVDDESLEYANYTKIDLDIAEKALKRLVESEYCMDKDRVILLKIIKHKAYKTILSEEF